MVDGHAQTDSLLVVGTKVLSNNGVLSQCFTYTRTSHGDFIGTRLDDNTPMNYLYRDNKLTLIPSLNSYVIFGYSNKHLALVVGFYNKRIKFKDTMAREFLLFKLETHQFVPQVKYSVDVYGVALSHDGDSLITFPNTKNPGGIGSNPQRRSMKIKSN
jgi:hypothetical protein